MSLSEINTQLDTAIVAARAAGEILRNQKEKIVTLTTGRDIKLSCDTDAERVIVDILRKQSPHPIFSEETVQDTHTKESRYWLVDPLDGTLNYYRGIPLSCVSIALMEKEHPLVGVVYDFNRGDLYTSIAGKAAHKNDVKLSVSYTEELSQTIIATGFPVGGNFSEESLRTSLTALRTMKKVRLLGSAALSLAYVAAGYIDIYFERDINIWDVAAGLSLVSGAGGLYTIENHGGHKCTVLATNFILSAQTKSIFFT